jgi:hypothetical protein
MMCSDSIWACLLIIGGKFEGFELGFYRLVRFMTVDILMMT